MNRWLSVAGQTFVRAATATGASFVVVAVLAILTSSETSGGTRSDVDPTVSHLASTVRATPRASERDLVPESSIDTTPPPPVRNTITPTSPPAAASPGPIVEDDVVPPLLARSFVIPVLGVERDALRDTFHDPRGRDRTHKALDIMAPRGRPVVAVEDGTVARLYQSERGGLTLYQFDPSSSYAYYYAHLDGYADGLKEGDAVRAGQLLGYVGSTGNAPDHAPHLHFAMYRLGPQKRWWRGDPINPFPILNRNGFVHPNPNPPYKENP